MKCMIDEREERRGEERREEERREEERRGERRRGEEEERRIIDLVSTLRSR